MNTTGDKILNQPLPKIGEKSLFTKELEEALERGDVDFVVHSLKDLPTTLPEKKTVGAILKREDPRDCVILHDKHRHLTLETLPRGSVIGTSSSRRTAQLSRLYPNVKVQSIRGNLNTRLEKLKDRNLYDGIVLATAAVKRIGWTDQISEVLNDDNVLYAVGQGALAVECREQDEEVLSLLQPLIHHDTVLLILAERSFLKRLGGGCFAPVAVRSSINDNILSLHGQVCSTDGSEMIEDGLKCALNEEKSETTENEVENGSGEPPLKRVCKPQQLFCGISPNSANITFLEKAEKLGVNLADLLIEKGALKLLNAAREEASKDVVKIQS
ncbi:porphobilinogen deaminase isoform X2 [Planococcus citri]